MANSLPPNDARLQVRLPASLAAAAGRVAAANQRTLAAEVRLHLTRLVDEDKKSNAPEGEARGAANGRERDRDDGR